MKVPAGGVKRHTERFVKLKTRQRIRPAEHSPPDSVGRDCLILTERRPPRKAATAAEVKRDELCREASVSRFLQSHRLSRMDSLGHATRESPLLAFTPDFRV